MPGTIGRPGEVMLCRLASIMKLSGLELGQVDTTRSGNLRSSLMKSFSYFVNVGVGSLSIFLQKRPS